MKKIQDFQEGVEHAKRLLNAFSQVGPLDSAAITSEGGFKIHALQAEGIQMIFKNPTELIERAKENPDDFDALRFGTAFQLKTGKELPPIILNWLVEYLLGKSKRPPGAAGRGNSLGLQVIIALAVQELADRGMFPMRNDGSPATSACDAVAKALSDLGKTPRSFERVKAIWLEINREKDEHGAIIYSF